MESDLSKICQAIPCSSNVDLSTQAHNILLGLTGVDEQFNLSATVPEYSYQQTVEIPVDGSISYAKRITMNRTSYVKATGFSLSSNPGLSYLDKVIDRQTVELKAPRIGWPEVTINDVTWIIWPSPIMGEYYSFDDGNTWQEYFKVILFRFVAPRHSNEYVGIRSMIGLVKMNESIMSITSPDQLVFEKFFDAQDSANFNTNFPNGICYFNVNNFSGDRGPVLFMNSYINNPWFTYPYTNSRLPAHAFRGFSGTTNVTIPSTNFDVHWFKFQYTTQRWGVLTNSTYLSHVRATVQSFTYESITDVQFMRFGYFSTVQLSGMDPIPEAGDPIIVPE